MTYSIEELLATKLRALYQRKKGRDLYDFWYATHHISDLNAQKIIDIFLHYMKKEKLHIFRAEFEKNLFLKQRDPVFNNDIDHLLPQTLAKQYQISDAYEVVFRNFLPKLPGDPWKKL